MKRLALVAVAIAVLAAAPAASPARHATPTKPAVRAALASAILAEINKVRASSNLAPLTVDPKLTAAATAHSTERLAKGYFAHESADGTAAVKRIKKYYKKSIVGENLLWFLGNMSAAQVVNAWMTNAPHKAILLDPRWRAVGIGALYARKAPAYYKNRPTTVITADFGA